MTNKSGNFHGSAAPESLLAAVVHLFLVSSPPTIHRPTVGFTLITFAATVMSFIVYTVDGISRRTWRHLAHVLNKSNEAIAPTLTYYDTSGAVIFIRDVAETVASRFSTVPRVPFRLSPETVKPSNAIKDAVLPLLKQSLGRNFILKAAAAFALVVFKLITWDRAFRSAIALAPPIPLQTSAFMDSQNSPTVEFSTSKIFANWRHDAPPLVRSLFEVRGKLGKETERFGSYPSRRMIILYSHGEVQ
jgi:hypothetical protein